MIKNFKSKNFNMYTVNQQSDNFILTKLSKYYLNFNKHNIEKGIYIFNYHEICEDEEVEVYKRNKLPNIYTSKKILNSI